MRRNIWLAVTAVCGVVEVVAAEADNNTQPPATELGKVAASLQPGEIREFKTKGYTRDLLKCWYEWDHDEKGTRIYGAQKMFNIMGSWANDGKWDPVTQQVLHCGIGHYSAFKFVTYSAISNEWKLMPVPIWVDPRVPGVPKGHGWSNNGWMKDPKTGEKKKCWPRGHTYDCQAIWPEKRLYALTMWSWLRLYDIDKQEWKPSVPGFRTNSGGPCEAFPELGGIVAFSAPSRLCVWSPDSGKKRDLGKIGFSMHGIMEYNPVHKVLIVGGGDARGDRPNRNVYLVDAEGKVSKLQPAPDWLRCTPDAKVMCDPVSGEYIIQGHRPRKGGKDLGKVYAFHPLKDEWKEISGPRFPGGVAVAVDTYGVIMICGGSKVYVYKHNPAWPGQSRVRNTSR